MYWGETAKSLFALNITDTGQTSLKFLGTPKSSGTSSVLKQSNECCPLLLFWTSQVHSLLHTLLPKLTFDHLQPTWYQSSTSWPTRNELSVGTPCVTEVQKVLSNLNPSKSSGPDGITARLLRELADDIADLLTWLFNQSLSNGVFRPAGRMPTSFLFISQVPRTLWLTTGVLLYLQFSLRCWRNVSFLDFLIT